MSLVVKNLSVRKTGKPIVQDASFIAPAGAVTGLIGPNGAGKSTLLTALLGLTPSQGQVEFGQSDLHAMPRRDRAKIAAYVEQSASTEERLTVFDVVALGRIPHHSSWAGALSREDSAIVNETLTETGMLRFAERRFQTLSGGEQQRVHVSRALAQAPKLLLLDEPTSHLDIKAQLQLLCLLRCKAAEGMTILLAIHDLNHAARFCDHLVVINQSKIVTQGAPAQVLTPSLLHDVYGVTARIETTPGINIFFEDITETWN